MSGTADGVLARALFALLVAGCFVAFFVTQRLKHTPTVVQRVEMAPYFSPTPTGHHKVELLAFRIEKSDEVTVTVIDSEGDTVATLATDRPLARYTEVTLSWNGRTGDSQQGPPAPQGDYRLHIVLVHQDRTVTSPRSFKLVRVPKHPGRVTAP